MFNAKPFVKWAGGKGQLIPQLETLFPKELSEGNDLTYVEPFVGGGAMLFHVLSKYGNIRKAVINDVNGRLVNAYRMVRDCPKVVVANLLVMQSEYLTLPDLRRKESYYLERRDEYNSISDFNHDRLASLFVFLNKTCFNGLHRVNKAGKFNVPFGKASNPLICDSETIYEDSKLLRNVEISSMDFERVFDGIGGNVFAYFDPPYRPLPNTKSFLSYAKEGFNDDQQRRLAKLCRKLDKRGFKWLLSNSDPHNTDREDMFFDELYGDFEISRVRASRMINSDGKGRGKITEIAVRNYF
jgi:DNA adenine methylase